MSSSDDLEALKAAALATLKHRQESRRKEDRRDKAEFELAALRAAALNSARNKALAAKRTAVAKVPSNIEVDEISDSGSDFSLIGDSSTNTTGDVARPDLLDDDAIPDLLQDFDIDEFNEDDLITEPEPRAPSPKRGQTTSKPKSKVSQRKSLDETKKDLKETISRLQKMKEEKRKTSSDSSRSKLKVDPVRTSARARRDKSPLSAHKIQLSADPVRTSARARRDKSPLSAHKIQLSAEPDRIRMVREATSPNTFNGAKPMKKDSTRLSNRDKKPEISQNITSGKSNSIDSDCRESTKENKKLKLVETSSKRIEVTKQTNDELEKITREKLLKRLEPQTQSVKTKPEKAANKINDAVDETSNGANKSVLTRLGAKLTEEECDQAMQTDRKRKTKTPTESSSAKQLITSSDTDVISVNESRSDEEVKLKDASPRPKPVAERLGGFSQGSNMNRSRRVISLDEEDPKYDINSRVKNRSDREMVSYDDEALKENPPIRKENIWMRSERKTRLKSGSRVSTEAKSRRAHERLHIRPRRSSSSPETVSGSSSLTSRSAREKMQSQTSRVRERAAASSRIGGIPGRASCEVYTRESSRKEKRPELSSSSKLSVSDSKPKTQAEMELDRKIQQIKERNAAIEAKQKEIEREKALYG